MFPGLRMRLLLATLCAACVATLQPADAALLFTIERTSDSTGKVTSSGSLDGVVPFNVGSLRLEDALDGADDGEGDTYDGTLSLAANDVTGIVTQGSGDLGFLFASAVFLSPNDALTGMAMLTFNTENWGAIGSSGDVIVFSESMFGDPVTIGSWQIVAPSSAEVPLPMSGALRVGGLLGVLAVGRRGNLAKSRSGTR